MKHVTHWSVSHRESARWWSRDSHESFFTLDVMVFDDYVLFQFQKFDQRVQPRRIETVFAALLHGHDAVRLAKAECNGNGSVAGILTLAMNAGCSDAIVKDFLSFELN